MIYFITDKKHNVIEVENHLKIFPYREGFEELELLLDVNHRCQLGFDLEATGLDAYTSSILLYIIGNKEHQFVIDHDVVIKHKDSFENLLTEFQLLDNQLKY